MFEALVITKSEKRGARSIASLPAAAAAHALLLGTWYVYTLYAPIAVKAPLAILRFREPLSIEIPVKIVHKAQVTREEAVQKQSEKVVPRAIEAPAQPPVGIQPVGPERYTPGVESQAEQGFIQVEGLLPGESTGEYVMKEPPVLHDYDLAKAPEIVSQVEPEYPAALKAMGVEGRAVIKITIGAGGDVEDAEVVTATNPLFGQSALDAVRRWRFTRSSTNAGSPVRVIKVITVNFRLR